jgi:L-lactate dehydrogenase (cytochrome)
MPNIDRRHDANLTWPDIEWIKSIAPDLPVVIKGIGAWEVSPAMTTMSMLNRVQDVVLAKKYGANAVVLSNHGGRQLD